MFPAAPWKTEAIVRLLVSVFLCILTGSLLASLVHHLQAPGPARWNVVAPAGAGMLLLAATLVLVRRPWAFETFVKRLGAAMLAFYSGLFFWAWAMKGAAPGRISVLHMIIASLSFQGAALVLLVGFLREHEATWAGAFGLKRDWRAAVLKGIILACLFLPLGWAMQAGSVELLQRWTQGGAAPEEQQAVTTIRLAASWMDRLALGAVTVLLAPLAEEFLFRGVLYSWSKQLGFPRLGLWITSLVFAGFHMNLATFLPLLVLAVMLALLYDRTGNLLAPIVAHSLFNAFNFTAVFILEKVAPGSAS